MSRVATQLISWSVTVLTARLLMPDDYGLVALAALFVGYVLFLGDLGLGAALVQSTAIDDADVRIIDSSIVLLGCMATVVLILSAPMLAAVVGEPRIVGLASFYAWLCVLVSTCVVPNALLMREMRFELLAKVAVASVLVQSATTLVLAYLGYGPWSLVLGTAASTVVQAVALRAATGQWTFARPRLDRLRVYLDFSRWVVGQRTVWYWYSNSDTAIVGKVLGSHLLGAFSMAKQLAVLPADKVMGPLNQIALPAFSRIQSEPELLSRHYLKMIRLSSLYAFPAFWGLAAIGPDLVDLLLGPKWHQVGQILPILCVALPTRILSSLTSTSLISVGRPDFAFRLTLPAIVIVPIAVLIGSLFGLVMLAASWAAAMAVVSAYFLARAARHLGVSRLQIARAARTSALAAAFMAFSLWAVHVLIASILSPATIVLLCVPIGVGVYVATVALLDRNLFLEARVFVWQALRPG